MSEHHDSPTPADSKGAEDGEPLPKAEGYALRWAASGVYQWMDFDCRADLLRMVEANQDYLYNPEWSRGTQVWRLDTDTNVYPAEVASLVAAREAEVRETVAAAIEAERDSGPQGLKIPTVSTYEAVTRAAAIARGDQKAGQ